MQDSLRAAHSEPGSLVQPIHTAVRGRARYRINGLYRADHLKTALEVELRGRAAITRASANTLTGNLLVHFEPDWELDEITEIITRVLRSATGEILVSYKPLPISRGTGAASSALDALGRRRLWRLLTRGAKQPSQIWHRMTVEQVLTALGASREGLTAKDAALRLRHYGPNVLPEALPRSGFSMFVEQFKSLPVGLLAASALLSVFTGGLLDALVIMGVVLLNGGIGYATESQAERTISALGRRTMPPAQVLRDKHIRMVRAEELVPGDILVLAPSTYVAADARLIKAERLNVDESTLTGESLAVGKSAAVLSRDVPLADRHNMIYGGTLVTSGQGLALVVATGGGTEIGMIQSMVGETRPPGTPLEQQLDHMSSQLVLLSGVLCLGVFSLGLLRGYRFLPMLKSAISLAVAAVPEGLPTVATTTLALGIRGMRRQNVLIRHLGAVEALGALQAICLDKTGTITLNRMSVVEIFSGGREIRIAEGRLQHGATVLDPAEPDLLRLGESVALCSETEIWTEAGAFMLQGSPTESALLQLAIGLGLDPLQLRKTHPLLRLDPRAEGRHFMRTIHKLDNGRRMLAVKGSPSQVLAMSNRYLLHGESRLLSDADRQHIENENERMAGSALRVLGVAMAELAEGEDEPAGLTWLGLVGMADPIRSGVKALLGRFHAAGVDTIMITGDQSATAYAIGKAIDLSHGQPLEILDSTHLEALDPEVLQTLAQRVQVFSRVSPAHKLQIVQALQRAGKVVAMTGDGVNDGPALKAADVGVAMGQMGTDVAREVADVILEDDNLQSMIAAIAQGRNIHDNIRKALHFLLATNLSEIVVMSGSLALGIGQPLSPMQLLWINLISDVFPALALSLEAPEPDVMERPPRNPREPIVRPADFRRIGFEAATISFGALGAYGYGLARYGAGPRAGSLAFMTLTLAQLAHAISARSERRSIFDPQRLPPNPYLNTALLGSCAVQLLALLLPGLRRLLGMSTVGVADALAIGGGALLPFVANEASKSSRAVGGAG